MPVVDVVGQIQVPGHVIQVSSLAIGNKNIFKGGVATEIQQRKLHFMMKIGHILQNWLHSQVGMR